MRNVRLFALVLALLLIACGSAPKVVEATTAPKAPTAAPEAARVVSDDESAGVPIASDDPVRGDRNARVTIVVFTDLQCPFCAKLAKTLDQLREKYGTKIRIVHKSQPLSFHEHAFRAAEIGAAVFETKGADAFFAYAARTFEAQARMSDDDLLANAAAVGVDTRVVEIGLRTGRWKAKVERDVALATSLGVQGTPQSFIDGISVGGAQPLSRFVEVIDAELAKAEEMLKRGVPPEKLYGVLVASNPRAKEEDDDDGDAAAVAREKAGAAIVWKVPVGASPVRGKPTALVTIVEFADFQCPYCKKVEATLERIQREYGERVRLVWKDSPLPFHPRAVPAASLARAVRANKGDDAFWKAHDALFASLPALEDSDLERVATNAGADGKQAIAAVTSSKFKKAIAIDEELAEDVQATGTPHFFVNGHRLVGAQPFEKFKERIDEELSKAEALVRTGVAPKSLYDTLIKDGKVNTLETKTVAIPASAPFRGAANAKVVIQHFSDFQCPFCSRVEPTLDDLLKEYAGKVKIVWRDMPLPFHVDAPLAAEAAREAFAQKGNEGFSKMRVMLFQHQGKDGLKRAALSSYARSIGLDVAKFEKALDDRVHRAAVEADAKAAEAAGISGTPAFVIGQYYVSGAQPIAKFRRVVDRVLAEPSANGSPAANSRVK